MVQRRFQDADGEYKLERGSYAGDVGVISKVLARLRTKRGSLIALPDFGSRLHLIKKLVAGATRLAEEYARESLSDLVAAREIRNLDVSAVIDRANGTAAICISISYRDRQGVRQSLSYTHTLKR